MDIAKEVREQADNYKLPLPSPNPQKPNQWRRMECPFCAGRPAKKPNGSINYALNSYYCFRCQKKIPEQWGTSKRRGDINDPRYPESSTRDTGTFRRANELWDYYAPVIANAVRYVTARIGKWSKDNRLNHEALRNKALEFVWDYSEGDRLAPNSAGMLDYWEGDSLGDRSKLFSYVGAALQGDLFNYAHREIRDLRKGGVKNAPLAGIDGETWTVDIAQPIADGNGDVKESQLDNLLDWQDPPSADSPDDPIPRIWSDNPDAPVGSESFNYGWLYVVLANDDKTKPSSWGREVARCKLTQNGLGPFKGHCQWCDAKLRKRHEMSLERYLRQYGGSQNWWWYEAPKPLGAREWDDVPEPPRDESRLEKLQTVSKAEMATAA
jgi:hypothetical protein